MSRGGSYVVRKDGSRVRNECYSPKGVRHGASMSSGSSEQVMGEVMAHSGGSSLVVPARTVPFPQGWGTVTDRRFAPVIDAVRPNITEFRYHADKFAMHLCARPAMKPEKRARNVLSTYLFRETVNPLIPRSVYEMTHSRKSDAADWLEEMHSIRGIDMNDETRDTARILRSNG